MRAAKTIDNTELLNMKPTDKSKNLLLLANDENSVKAKLEFHHRNGPKCSLRHHDLKHTKKLRVLQHVIQAWIGFEASVFIL